MPFFCFHLTLINIAIWREWFVDCEDDMKIRKARHADVPKLEKLWIELMDHHIEIDPDYSRSKDAVENWMKYLDVKFESDDAVLFVAANDRDIVGYISVWIRDYPPVYEIKKYGLIEEIAVTANSRRQRIASQLWSAAEEWLLSRGIKRIRADIDAANPESQGFFRGIGFTDDAQTLMRKY